MPENDFLTFAAASGANVLSQASYAALSAQATGFISGVAQSAAVNKVLRQCSIISSMIAQLIADKTGQSVIDDGTIATIESNFYSIFSPAGNYQPALGFTPVQQGTGVGQNANTIKLGWSSALGKLKATVDVTDEGNIALENWTYNNFSPLITGSPGGGYITFPVGGQSVTLQWLSNGYPSGGSSEIGINAFYPVGFRSSVLGWCWCATDQLSGASSDWRVMTKTTSLTYQFLSVINTSGPIPTDYGVSGFIIGI